MERGWQGTEGRRAALISNCKVDFNAAVALPLLPTCFRPRCGTFRSVSMLAKGGEAGGWKEEGAGVEEGVVQAHCCGV